MIQVIDGILDANAIGIGALKISRSFFVLNFREQA